MFCKSLALALLISAATVSAENLPGFGGPPVPFRGSGYPIGNSPPFAQYSTNEAPAQQIPSQVPSLGSGNSGFPGQGTSNNFGYPGQVPTYQQSPSYGQPGLNAFNGELPTYRLPSNGQPGLNTFNGELPTYILPSNGQPGLNTFNGAFPTYRLSSNGQPGLNIFNGEFPANRLSNGDRTYDGFQKPSTSAPETFQFGHSTAYPVPIPASVPKDNAAGSWKPDVPGFQGLPAYYGHNPVYQGSESTFDFGSSAQPPSDQVVSPTADDVRPPVQFAYPDTGPFSFQPDMREVPKTSTDDSSFGEFHTFQDDSSPADLPKGSAHDLLVHEYPNFSDNDIFNDGEDIPNYPLNLFNGDTGNDRDVNDSNDDNDDNKKGTDDDDRNNKFHYGVLDVNNDDNYYDHNDNKSDDDDVDNAVNGDDDFDNANDDNLGCDDDNEDLDYDNDDDADDDVSNYERDNEDDDVNKCEDGDEDKDDDDEVNKYDEGDDDDCGVGNYEDDEDLGYDDKDVIIVVIGCNDNVDDDGDSNYDYDVDYEAENDGNDEDDDGDDGGNDEDDDHDIDENDYSDFDKGKGQESQRPGRMAFVKSRPLGYDPRFTTVILSWKIANRFPYVLSPRHRHRKHDVGRFGNSHSVDIAKRHDFKPSDIVHVRYSYESYDFYYPFRRKRSWLCRSCEDYQK